MPGETASDRYVDYHKHARQASGLAYMLADRVMAFEPRWAKALRSALIWIERHAADDAFVPLCNELAETMRLLAAARDSMDWLSKES